MTKSYAQIKATIAKLEKEAAALRAAETTKVVAQIRESIATFGLTVEQLFGRKAKALKAAAGKALGGGKAARKGAGIPKYRDPKTGKTWTGFGKAPSWIAGARNRDKFLIAQPGDATVPSAKEAAAPDAAAAKKAARKARTAATPAKKSIRGKKTPPASTSAPEIKAEKRVAKKAVAKKSAASKKTAPAKKAAAAPKAPKAAKKPVSAKTRSLRSSTKAAAPAVTSAAPETAETGASGS